MKGFFIAAFLLINILLFGGSAYAAESSTGFSFFYSFIQMLGSLAIVIGVIFVLYYAARKWLVFLTPDIGRKNYIRVIESRYIAPKQSLLLIEVKGKYFLVSSSPSGVSLIKEIDMLEDIEIIDSAHNIEDSSFQKMFGSILNRFAKPSASPLKDK